MSMEGDFNKNMICEKCKADLQEDYLKKNFYVCGCGNHLRMTARQRIEIFTDRNSFREHDVDLKSTNILGFESYDEKLSSACKSTGENEAVITGEGKLNGNVCCFFFMEPNFMMASMGSVVGEKITRIFEYAAQKKMSVVGFCASGGARMQEGMISLMQMAKTNGAVKYHNDAGGFFLSVLTDPTTGGVTASFATAADIIVAEPNALIGFAGQRVIKQTMKEDLPEGFQSSEFALEKGMIDEIIPRSELKNYLDFMLKAHCR